MPPPAVAESELDITRCPSRGDECRASAVSHGYGFITINLSVRRPHVGHRVRAATLSSPSPSSPSARRPCGETRRRRARSAWPSGRPAPVFGPARAPREACCRWKRLISASSSSALGGGRVLAPPRRRRDAAARRRSRPGRCSKPMRSASRASASADGDHLAELADVARPAVEAQRLEGASSNGFARSPIR